MKDETFITIFLFFVGASMVTIAGANVAMLMIKLMA
jgi:hypothetical protein